MSHSLHVESGDVVKLIQQFLREQNLHGSLAALQEESQVTLNTVDSVDKFTADVTSGRWEAVLTATQSMTLPTALMADLMAQIVLELAESKETDAARALLRAAPALAQLKQTKPERYLHLEHLLSRATASGSLDVNAAFGPAGRDARRQDLASALASHVEVAPPSRLLSLLTQALKYQQLQGLLPRGARYDLFRGGLPTDPAAAAAAAGDAYPTKNARIIKFGAKSYPESARFSPDGALLASGSCDGYIELWDATSGKLQTADFAYQAEDQLMSHDSAVLCLSFNTGMDLLASGGAKGDIKVWRLATGSCVRKFAAAHADGVTQVEFARDGTSVYSSGFDGVVRVHGLKSGRMLKEFRGHTSFVTAFVIARDESAAAASSSATDRLLTASADGTVRVWDTKTQDCVRVVRFHPAGVPAPSLLGILSIPAAVGATDRFVVVERSGILRIIDATGTVLQQLQSTSSATAASAAATATAAAASPADAKPVSIAARKKGGGESGGAVSAAGDFVCAAISPKGRFVYAVTEECVLHCFELHGASGAAGAAPAATGTLVHAIKVHRGDIVGLAHHPHRSTLASYAQEGNIKLWTP